MKHYRLLTAVLSLTAVLGGCSDNENEQSGINGRTALSINAGIGQNSDAGSGGDISTRATDTSWQPGDAIGIILLDAGTTTVAEGKTNYKYLTTNGSSTFAPDGKQNTAYYPTGGAEVDVLAYYPHTTTVTPANLAIPIDVSDQQDLAAIDLMTAAKVTGLSSRKPDVTLTFTHRLCKLILKVVTDETTADQNLAGARAVLSGTPTTGSWNLATSKLTLPAGEEGAKDLTLPLSADGSTATAITMPTPAGSGKTITLTLADGKSYVAGIASNLALAAGTVNTYTMTLHRNQAAITATIAPWTEGTTANLQTLHIEVPADATADGLTTFRMWRNQAQDTDTRTYTFDATAGKGAWTATPHPFYIEEVADGDKFFALHTPADARKDKVTGLKDLLAAGPATLQAATGGATGSASGSAGNTPNSLALNFTHLMAQLTVTLARSEDFPAGASLEGATVSLPTMTAGYKLNGISLTADDTQKKDYPALPVANGRTGVLTVVPQTLPADAEISVRLTNGNTYKAMLKAAAAGGNSAAVAAGNAEGGNSEGITLATGTRTNLVLTLSPAQASIAATVAPWTEQDAASQTVTIEGIGTGTATGSYTPAPGDRLVLQAINESMPDEQHTATYIYKENSGWTSDAPLYWDNFTRFAANANVQALTGTARNIAAGTTRSSAACTFLFHALIVPAAAPSDERAACGAVKDYLQGTLTAVSFGSPLSFRLTHLMAQVGITLKPGTGYTTQYLADHATLHLHGLRTLADDGVTPDGTLTLSPAPASAPLKMTRAAQPGADGTYTYTALVAPQTIAKGDIVARITLKQSDDATLPQALTYDYRAPEAGFPYNAGQNNKLLLTVSKAGVSAVFTLTPWDDSQEPTKGDVTVD